MSDELIELCKEVYEATGWEDTESIAIFMGDGWIESLGESMANNRGMRNLHIPLYTSDYLLEKLDGFGFMDGPSKGVELMQDNNNGWGWLAHIPDYYYKYGGDKWVGFADTPLKALLRLTIALHKAGELN